MGMGKFEKLKMGKSSSDDGAKAAKAGACACGVCCLLCIGIPCCIIIIIIIIIVVVVAGAVDSATDCDGITAGLNKCCRDESELVEGKCTGMMSCKGDRTCKDQVCIGADNCDL